jgi:hypothetical protein
MSVYRIRKIAQPNYTFTSYTVLSGKSAVDYSYPYGAVTIPINIMYGDNNIEVVWTEGDDTTPVYSSTIDLAVTHKLGGGYYLQVTDGYGNQVSDSPSGIICAPSQPLVFMVGATGQSGADATHWDFGDGALWDGAIVDHRYSQQSDQNQSFYIYMLTITLPDSSTVGIPVTVQDTQEGELWGPEVWRGAHTVVGVVVVPTGLNLHIATNATVPTETVSFEGDSASGYAQGITVNGTLTIDGGVTLQAASGQTQGWSTILVTNGGTATIGSATGSVTTIENADRGVAVDSSAGAVSLTNVTLTNNVTGLQVLGTTKVSVTGCTITGNTVYGIKEDAGGRPTVDNTAFTGNFRSYYQWDGGVISIDQLNKLTGNSGNQGE